MPTPGTQVNNIAYSLYFSWGFNQPGRELRGMVNHAHGQLTAEGVPSHQGTPNQALQAGGCVGDPSFQ